MVLDLRSFPTRAILQNVRKTQARCIGGASVWWHSRIRQDAWRIPGELRSFLPDCPGDQWATSVWCANDVRIRRDELRYHRSALPYQHHIAFAQHPLAVWPSLQWKADANERLSITLVTTTALWWITRRWLVGVRADQESGGHRPAWLLIAHASGDRNLRGQPHWSVIDARHWYSFLWVTNDHHTLPE